MLTAWLAVAVQIVCAVGQTTDGASNEDRRLLIEKSRVLAEPMVSLDATWRIRYEFAEPVAKKLGVKAEEGSLRIVVDSEYAWISARWTPALGRTAITHEAIVPTKIETGGDRSARLIVTHVVTGSESSVSIGNKLGVGQSPADLPILLQWDIYLPGAQPSGLADLLKAIDKKSISVRQDGLLRIATSPIDAADSALDSFILLDQNGPVAIAGDGVRPRNPVRPAGVGGDAAEAPNGNEAIVLEWATVDGRRLPRRLQRSYFTWFPGRDAPDAQVVTYELESLSQSPERVQSLVDVRSWLTQDTPISDERDGALTAIGATTITVEGARYKSNRPISADDVLSGRHLSSLCDGKVDQSDLRGADDASMAPEYVKGRQELHDPTSSSGFSVMRIARSWAGTTFLGVVVLTIGVIAVLRRRRANP